MPSNPPARWHNHCIARRASRTIIHLHSDPPARLLHGNPHLQVSPHLHGNMHIPRPSSNSLAQRSAVHLHINPHQHGDTSLARRHTCTQHSAAFPCTTNKHGTEFTRRPICTAIICTALSSGSHAQQLTNAYSNLEAPQPHPSASLAKVTRPTSAADQPCRIHLPTPAPMPHGQRRSQAQAIYLKPLTLVFLSCRPRRISGSSIAMYSIIFIILLPPSSVELYASCTIRRNSSKRKKWISRPAIWSGPALVRTI